MTENKGKTVARLERLELPTRCLEGSCSIHLSYRRVLEDSRPAAPACFQGFFQVDRGDRI